MKKTVFTFGLIAGAILGVPMVVMVPLCTNGNLEFEKSELIGYTAMVLAFLAVFFGIRSYREGEGGGAITFGRALKVGLLITLVASVLYVAAWEIVFHAFVPDFAETYSKHMIEKLSRSGVSPERVAAERQRMARFKELYANPFINVGMTFLEVFPIGAVMTLLSAGFLRKKPGPDGPAGSAAVA